MRPAYARTHPRLVASVVLAMFLAAGLTACGGADPDPIVPQVWSKHGPDGASFEYKVNDFQAHDRVEDGLLFGLDALVVHEPGGGQVPLQIDLPGTVGDGATNPRWVVYGPPGAGFPETGRYEFVFWREGAEVRRMRVDYVLRWIGYPTDVHAEVGVDDVLRVSWTAPDPGPVHDYKVLVWAGAELRVSESVSGGVSSIEVAGAAAMLGPGSEFRVSVAAFGNESFAYSQDFLLELNGP